MDFLHWQFLSRNGIRIYRTHPLTFSNRRSSYGRNRTYLARQPTGRTRSYARPDRGQKPRDNTADIYHSTARRAYGIERSFHLQFNRWTPADLLRRGMVRLQYGMKRYAQRVAYRSGQSGNRNDSAKHSGNRYRRNRRNAYGSAQRYSEKRAISGFRLPLSRYRHRNGRLYGIRDTRFDGVYDRTVFRRSVQRNEYHRFPNVEHRRYRSHSY